MNAFYFRRHLFRKEDSDFVVRRYVVFSLIAGLLEVIVVVIWFVVYTNLWSTWGVMGENISLNWKWGQ